MEDMVDLIKKRLIVTDDALGKEVLALVGPGKVGDGLVAMASQHISQAVMLLELAGGRALAVAVLDARLTDLRRAAH